MFESAITLDTTGWETANAFAASERGDQCWLFRSVVTLKQSRHCSRLLLVAFLSVADWNGPERQRKEAILALRPSETEGRFFTNNQRQRGPSVHRRPMP